MNAELFEQTVVEEICRIAEENDMNYSQLAKAAFGDAEKSITRWRQIRLPRKNTGKPQSLAVADTYSLCQGLGIDFGALMFMAGERFKINQAKIASERKKLA
ncbi:hypothetical protein [Maridesulfovibrio sp.]|uniref:hypothetical protein n=1 Tax=unclassified Maridesulfovibrio TaxID=2794999 RepID=UPI003B009E56